MEQHRNFKGIWIPSEIWLTNELTILEKILLVEIDSLEDEEKGCYASNKYFGTFFKLSNGRISQLINSLKEKGYIEIDYIYSGKEIEERQIRINKPPYPEVFNKLNTYLENDNRGIKNIKEGYLENFKDNNININNINTNNIKENIKRYFDNDTINELFIEFLNQRKKLKAVNSERAISNLINKLKEYPEEVQIEMINNSITNSWKGIFPLKGTDIKKNNNKEQWEIIKAIENGQIKYTSNESIEDDFYI